MISKAEVLTQLSNFKPELQKKYDISELGLFGSFARDEAGPSSDIDILLDFDENAKISLFKMVDLQDFMECRLGRRVHIALKQKLKKRMGKRILREARFV